MDVKNKNESTEKLNTNDENTRENLIDTNSEVDSLYTEDKTKTYTETKIETKSENDTELNFDIEAEPNIDVDKTNGKEPNYVREIFEMVIYFVVVICSVFLIHQFVGQQIQVSGSSMENTLQNKDHLILEKLSYEFGDPKRFDIVVFRPYSVDKDTYYIKRVIGLPGETIQIIESDIYINGELLEEHYGNEPIIDGGIANEVIELGEDEYFLLGDNRNNSKDSRDSSIGAVHSSAIIGRAWVRIWPFNKIEVLEHQ